MLTLGVPSQSDISDTCRDRDGSGDGKRMRVAFRMALAVTRVGYHVLLFVMEGNVQQYKGI